MSLLTTTDPDPLNAPLTSPAAIVGRRFPRWATAVFWVVVAIAAMSTASYLTNEPQLTASSTIQIGLLRALPILLAALGGLWAERSGVINIGLEGMMIFGTWGAAFGGYFWGPWVGVLAAAIFGAIGGALHALATVTFGVNHIVSGVAINLLGAGVAKYLSSLIFAPISHNPRASPPVPTFDTYSVRGLGDWLGSLEKMQRVGLSDVAGILRGLVTGLSPLTVLAVLLVPASYLVLWRTRFGLRLRSCGENPIAAESLGVKVYLHKYIAVIISGAMAGLGGATLVLSPGSTGYLENQTDGRGYIGLAAMIFGNWRPSGLLGGAALFGYTDGLQLGPGGDAVLALLYAVVLLIVVIVIVQLFRRRWLSAGIGAVAAVFLYWIYWSVGSLPRELTAYTPHIVTLIVMGVASQRLRPPKAQGFIYRRGSGG
ncbi:MAG: ABC transporter permease [Sciscionella sp.]